MLRKGDEWGAGILAALFLGCLVLAAILKGAGM